MMPYLTGFVVAVLVSIGAVAIGMLAVMLVTGAHALLSVIV